MSSKWVHHPAPPPQWGEGLRLTELSFGQFQVDDIDCVMSGDGKRDQTAFFRYDSLYEALGKRLAAGEGLQKCLSLPSSIGCEAYSLAAIFQRHADPARTALEVHMADISEKKLRAAETGIYPQRFRRFLPIDYADMFVPDGEYIAVRPDIKSMVKALPPMDVMEQPEMAERYNMVVALNLLCYLPDQESRVAAARYLASLSDDVLCISHGVKKNYVTDKEAVDAAIMEAGFAEDPFFYKPYRSYEWSQVFIRQPG